MYEKEFILFRVWQLIFHKIAFYTSPFYPQAFEYMKQ